MKKEIRMGDDTFSLLMDLKGLMEEYGQPEEDQEYWGALLEASGKLCKKYDGHPFRELITAAATCLHMQAKAGGAV